MTREWALVGSGFAIAAVGAGATCLYITGVSCLYVGRFAAGGGALVGATIGAVVFTRLLGPYLDELDARVDDEATDTPHAG